MVNDYPKVQVTGAPGYEDFEGELLMDASRSDGVMISVVGARDGDENTVHVIESKYVEEV